MKKKKAEKIKDSIVLSIKYARLQNAIKDSQDRKRDSVEKKKLIEKNEKKLDDEELLMDEIKEEIAVIELENRKSTYSLLSDKKLLDQIKKLSKSKDFALLKYRIAVDIVMDKNFKSTEKTHKGSIEFLSELLFNDKNVIREIEKSYDHIAYHIYGIDVDNPPSSIVLRNPGNGLKKVVSRKPLLAAGAAVLGAAFNKKDREKRRKINKISSFGPGELANKLISSAIILTHVEKHFTSEMGFKKFSGSVFNEINMERSEVARKLFEEHYEVEENLLKMELLRNFDMYIMGQMDLRIKKVERKKEHV